MGRRHDTRGICKDRVYRLRQAARVVGVSEATMGRWDSLGLKIIKDKRPCIVRGVDLIAFLEKRRSEGKAPMQKGQFYCLRCKAPRDAFGACAVFVASNELTGRLKATCATCGGRCGRFCGTSDLTALADVLQIKIKVGR